ncbi:MAG: hypothetical protein WBD40_03445 [Tepidisphaeraceae bacterium]
MPAPTWLLVILTLIAAGLACAAPVRARIYRAARRLRRMTPRQRAIATAAVFVIAAAYLSFTALWQGRPLYPKYHDSQSYAIQAQIIASGRLWLPPHPMADFFDTFHVIVTPAYCSMYFPGTAMAFAVGVLAGAPFWIIAALISAGCVALLFSVIAEIVDGWAGAVAAVWLLSLMWFRYVSVIVMSQPLMLLLGLAMFCAYLRWRRERRIGWAMLIGAFAGFAAVTRPADALAYALPLGAAILYDCFRRPLREFLTTAGAIVAAAAPWLVLQVIFNLGVTGEAFHSPYRLYLDRDAPQFSFGFHKSDLTKLPRSPIVQKTEYHVRYNRPMILAHRPERLLDAWLNPRTGRLMDVLAATLPSPVPLDTLTPTAIALIPLLFAGLFGLTTVPRRALAAVFPLYCFFYLFYAALLRHYTPVVAPATILLAMLGMRQVESLWPRRRAAVATFAAVMVVGQCILALPEMNPNVRDDPFEYVELIDAREIIPTSVQQPALVLVKFTPRPDENVHGEPVYNWEAAKIDDNPIIFAHDLGERNIELIRYYAQRRPARRVYYFDRVDRKLKSAGTVAAELERLETLQPQQLPPPTTAPE